MNFSSTIDIAFMTTIFAELKDNRNRTILPITFAAMTFATIHILSFQVRVSSLNTTRGAIVSMCTESMHVSFCPQFI